MVFYINDNKGHRFAMQEDTFGLCNKTLVMTGLKYYFSDTEIGTFMSKLGSGAVNYNLENAECLYKISPHKPFFADLDKSSVVGEETV